MVKPKDVYTKEEDIPDGLQDYYSKTDDGWAFDGFDDSPSKSKISEFRSTNIQLRREKEKLQQNFEDLQGQFDGVDPDQYKEAVKMISQIKEDEEKTLIKQGKIDEVVARRTAAAIEEGRTQLKAKDDALAKAKTESIKLKDRLGELLIDREVQLNISKAKVAVQEGALSDVLNRARETWKINEEGNMIPMEIDTSTGKFKTKYGTDGNVLAMDEYVTGLVSSAAHLFKPATGGGGPGKEHDEVARPGQKKRVDFADPLAFGENLEEIAKGKVQDAR